MSLVLNSVREAAVMEQIWVVQYPANSLGASQGSPNVRGEPSCPRLQTCPGPYRPNCGVGSREFPEQKPVCMAALWKKTQGLGRLLLFFWGESKYTSVSVCKKQVIICTGQATVTLRAEAPPVLLPLDDSWVPYVERGSMRLVIEKFNISPWGSSPCLSQLRQVLDAFDFSQGLILYCTTAVLIHYGHGCSMCAVCVCVSFNNQSSKEQRLHERTDQQAFVVAVSEDQSFHGVFEGRSTSTYKETSDNATINFQKVRPGWCLKALSISQTTLLCQHNCAACAPWSSYSILPRDSSYKRSSSFARAVVAVGLMHKTA
ncbi:hypothetical protein Anapl_15550 [Anas platyrhynchos]|uniref:Uncharacterized protein n=1 Tax=Anas platyrhynchos TaxID=8839 RepID=R0LH53_ANAPL|nr:hypothetical protein Anapl_15550 [Anas platyrhynchos]